MTHKKPIYLDYAAATPVDPSVIAAMQPYFAEQFYNPAANYSGGREVKELITEAKQRIGHQLGVKANEIIHTSGGTEANNLAITGVMQAFADKKVLISAVEHESVSQPAAQFKHDFIPVDARGRVDLAKLEAMIDDDVVLVSVMLANNEIGTVQPLRQISEIIKKVRDTRLKRQQKLPLYLHTDACQAPSYLDIHAHRLGVDMMTLNGGKIYGPKQSGILYVSSQLKLQPQLLGGGQQRGLRSGTESAASVIGFAAALDLAAETKDKEVKRLRDLQTYFFDETRRINPATIINGSMTKRLPNNVHLTFPGIDNERLLFSLDELGIYAASGSACSAETDKTSMVLKAIGVSDKLARNSLRFTLGRATTKADIDYTLASLKSLNTSKDDAVSSS